MTTRFSPVTVVFAALAVTVLLGGCENLIQALGGLEPGTVQASQGEYDGRIEIIWTEIVDSDGDEREAEEYEVVRETADGSGGWTDSKDFSGVDDTSYTDTDVQNGTAYRYSIRAVFSATEKCLLPCDPAEATEYGDGYALSAVDLTVHTEQKSSQGEQSFDASVSDRWFEFTAQQGWTYKIEITGTTNTVEVYQRGDIVDPVHDDTGVGSTSFTTGKTSVHHIRIPTGNGSGRISVSY